MKVLGIYGSPRKGGNSDLLLEEALRGAEAAGAESASVRAAALDIGGCKACGACDKTGECSFRDGMDEVYPLLDDADRILLASPMYFYGFPAQLKALVDRAQARWSRRMLVKTAEERKRYDSGRGYLIAVGATRGKRLFEGAELMARFFFDALDMEYAGGLFFKGMDAKGEIRSHSEALAEARDLGRRAVLEA